MIQLTLSDAQAFAMANILVYWEVLAQPDEDVRQDIDNIRSKLYEHIKDKITSSDKQTILSKLGSIDI